MVRNQECEILHSGLKIMLKYEKSEAKEFCLARTLFFCVKFKSSGCFRPFGS